ncbi:MAG: Glycosyl transferase family 2 [Microgenomates group bacterium GW2011_GWA2_39_19]|nr:MAG: Glycosyl transferase family 2 [Microgenomates group bacterium GW2011_GWA2_39_19]
MNAMLYRLSHEPLYLYFTSLGVVESRYNGSLFLLIMITAIVLAKNEEKNIERCLKSLKWCDETIVIDDFSSDRTLEIAKKFNATIYQRILENDFSSQRNFGLSRAKGDWVLFVDADEVVESSLKDEISSKILASPFEGFCIKRKDFMWGKELKFGETASLKFVRLARRDAGKWIGIVHEEWKIRGKVGEFDGFIEHYPHQILGEFIKEIDYYSTWHAKSKFDKGERSSLVKILVMPKAKFFQNWIIRGGFRDGTEGFLVSILMSFHSFLAWSKLWLLERKVSRGLRQVPLTHDTCSAF